MWIHGPRGSISGFHFAGQPIAELQFFYTVLLLFVHYNVHQLIIDRNSTMASSNDNMSMEEVLDEEFGDTLDESDSENDGQQDDDDDDEGDSDYKDEDYVDVPEDVEIQPSKKQKLSGMFVVWIHMLTSSDLVRYFIRQSQGSNSTGKEA